MFKQVEVLLPGEFQGEKEFKDEEKLQGWKIVLGEVREIAPAAVTYTKANTRAGGRGPEGGQGGGGGDSV